MKKRVLSILIAAVLCMSMCTAVFATETEEAVDSEDITMSTEQENLPEEELDEDIDEDIEADYGIATLSASSQNTPATAATFKFGTKYTGSLSSYGEKDYWKFTLSSSGRITLNFETATKYSMIKIYGDNGTTELFSKTLYGGTSSNLESESYEIDLLQGNYYIMVTSALNSHEDYGKYTLKASFSSANESFPEKEGSNKTLASDSNSISINNTYYGLMALNDRSDWYKFTLKNAQDLKVTLTNAGTQHYSYKQSFKIYKANDLNTPIWTKEIKVGNTSSTVNLSKGTYYLQVSISNYNDYACGPYHFRLALDGVCKADNGTWYNYNNGTIQKKATVAKNSNGWWYIDKNGKVDFSYTGFASNSNGKWYCEKGKVTFKKNGVIKDTKGALGTKGAWYYVKGSKVQTGYTGVADYKNSNGWWYVKNGKVDFSANTVAKNKNGWWYVTGGKVRFNYTGVSNYKNKNGWWYIKNGKVDFSFTGKAKNKNGTWNIVNGKVKF